ncbi:MAG: hypothetical protein MI864_27785 [Pseudomonadales bacterium]|uniref:Uncharacterized protein n=1 Tax=Oleiphilus messinensis TaxID=141451 RepID=A0A1Y0IHN6_9GAMM|nr:hypothetical protein [Oleiphilus messinensis]ARU59366.1 hypothetical protein OLMES_5386 [Oleiphilus messinensis]MCG8614332.1 hypothetical protein [Pseudomonadales bacterium]
MIQQIFITIGILLYAFGVPVLELNDTHVWNPNWPPHARIHEVWQLTTNTAIGVLSLWMLWVRRTVWLPALLSGFVMGGFMFAYFCRETYGGSMQYLDGSEKLVFGVNIGVVGFGTALLLLACAVLAQFISPLLNPNR